uniref:Uncharacterized protein n=1 Tax=Octopus bimaculoides TaxID=37653 RepID=A0A0L8II14_OCTBM
MLHHLWSAAIHEIESVIHQQQPVLKLNKIKAWVLNTWVFIQVYEAINENCDRLNFDGC